MRHYVACGILSHQILGMGCPTIFTHHFVLTTLPIDVVDSPEGLSAKSILEQYHKLGQTTLRHFATLCIQVRHFATCKFCSCSVQPSP